MRAFFTLKAQRVGRYGRIGPNVFRPTNLRDGQGQYEAWPSLLIFLFYTYKFIKIRGLFGSNIFLNI